ARVLDPVGVVPAVVVEGVLLLVEQAQEPADLDAGVVLELVRAGQRPLLVDRRRLPGGADCAVPVAADVLGLLVAAAVVDPERPDAASLVREELVVPG